MTVLTWQQGRHRIQVPPADVFALSVSGLQQDAPTICSPQSKTACVRDHTACLWYGTSARANQPRMYARYQVCISCALKVAERPINELLQLSPSPKIGLQYRRSAHDWFHWHQRHAENTEHAQAICALTICSSIYPCAQETRKWRGRSYPESYAMMQIRGPEARTSREAII